MEDEPEPQHYEQGSEEGYEEGYEEEWEGDAGTGPTEEMEEEAAEKPEAPKKVASPQAAVQMIMTQHASSSHGLSEKCLEQPLAMWESVRVHSRALIGALPYLATCRWPLLQLGHRQLQRRAIRISSLLLLQHRVHPGVECRNMKTAMSILAPVTSALVQP